MLVFLIPALVTLGESILEYATRPETNIDRNVDLHGRIAIVTGGCSGMGFALSRMLLETGATVVLGCRGGFDRLRDVERRLEDGLMTFAFADVEDELYEGNVAQPEPITEDAAVHVWSLDLESFESVSDFAQQFHLEFESTKPHVLIHNAGTTETCRLTTDGYEVAFQTNYLSPFLLTDLLMTPSETRETYESSSRVVHVTCDAALVDVDWLPWPLRRVSQRDLPRLDMSALSNGTAYVETCDPGRAYAASKLAVLTHSNELHRRMSTDDASSTTPSATTRRRKMKRKKKTMTSTHRPPIVSSAVNPGPTATGDSGLAPRPTRKLSLRQRIFQYFPPVWVFGKVSSFVYEKIRVAMLREVNVGAASIFHVATSSLVDGGRLYSDQASSLTDCPRGAMPNQCGGMTHQPVAALDRDVASALWEGSRQAVAAFV